MAEAITLVCDVLREARSYDREHEGEWAEPAEGLLLEASRRARARGSPPETRSPARECREDLGASQARYAQGVGPQEGRNEEALRRQPQGIVPPGREPVVAIRTRILDAGPTSDLASMGGGHLACFERVTGYRYVPIRRLGLYIEGRLYRGTHWVVFEPNDERAALQFSCRPPAGPSFGQGPAPNAAAGGTRQAWPRSEATLLRVCRRLKGGRRVRTLVRVHPDDHHRPPPSADGQGGPGSTSRLREPDRSHASVESDRSPSPPGRHTPGEPAVRAAGDSRVIPTGDLRHATRASPSRTAPHIQVGDSGLARSTPDVT